MKKVIGICLLGALVFLGCSSEDSSTKSSGYSGVIVDPYIVGAVLCEDVNTNGTCDEGEQLSTPSDAQGEFSFKEELTPGSHIIIKTQGKHQGRTYDVAISGEVDSDGEIEVISPLTTLNTKGLTVSEIETLLNSANITGFTSSELFSDPMGDGLKDKTIDNVTNSDLMNLRASIAVYGLLRVMNGSQALRELSKEEFLASSEVNSILKAMNSGISNSLNTTVLKNVDDSFKDYYAYIPKVTVEVVIKTAVAVMDRLTYIGYTTCNSSDGNVTLALESVDGNISSVTGKIGDLGQYFYGQVNSNSLKNSMQQVKDSLPEKVKSGMNLSKDTFVFDEDNNLVEYSEN